MSNCKYVVTQVNEETNTMEVVYTLNNVDILVGMPLPTTGESVESIVSQYMPRDFDNKKSFQKVEEGTEGSLATKESFEQFEKKYDKILNGIPQASKSSIDKLQNIELKYIKIAPLYTKTNVLVGIEVIMPASKYILDTKTGSSILLEAGRIVSNAIELGVFCIASNAKEKSVEFFVKNYNAGVLERADGYTVIYTPWTDELETAKENEFKNIIRQKRNQLLAATDYVFNPDVQVNNLDEVKEYRQQLRNITDQIGFPNKVVWPKSPL